MKTIRNLIQLCLLGVVLLAPPAVVQAQTYTDTYGNWGYTVTNDTITITGYSPISFNPYVLFGPITFPSSINVGSASNPDYLPVTSIGDSFSGILSEYFTSVTIPSTITNIGAYAFEDDLNLTTVTIDNGLTYIGEYAFSDCPSLTAVYYYGPFPTEGRDAFILDNNVIFYCLGWVLDLTTTSLPNGTNGLVYRQTLTASGGQPPYIWTNISGTLPPGLMLATNGLISGTPTTNGTFNFTVKVADALSKTLTQPLTITVIGLPSVTIQPTNNVPATSAIAASAVGQRVSATPPAITTPATPKPSAANSMGIAEVVAKFVEGKNVPVEFYGLVIDQNSNALAGVDVKVSVQQLTASNPATMELGAKQVPFERITGPDGRFEINGLKGESLDLASIQKDGYEVEPTKRGFGSASGSFDQPVVFKMWSTNIHEKLIGGGKSFHIVPDGRPYFINLTDDTVSESGEGDLKVWVQYTNQVVHGQLYDWSAGIEVINGGLLEEPLGTAMYQAPTDGYIPSFQLKQQIKGGQSGEIGDRLFYLKLKNGQEYGQMAIDLYAPWNSQIPGMIRLSYAINPSGSRILR